MGWPVPVGSRRRRGERGKQAKRYLCEGCMEGSDLTRSAKRHGGRDDARLSVAIANNDGAPSASMAPAMALGAARIELDALEAELAYRGPERRNGPGAGLAKLLASVLD